MMPNYYCILFKKYWNLINMNLFNVLINERVLLEKSWSETTIYPGSLIDDLNKSVGQCFVTSSFIYFFLKELFVKRKFLIKRGVVFDKTNNVILANHCWVEMIGTRNQKFIIDLTLDQSKTIKEKVIANNRDFVINKLGLYYFSYREHRYHSYYEIENENARKRYINLVRNRVKIIND